LVSYYCRVRTGIAIEFRFWAKASPGRPDATGKAGDQAGFSDPLGQLRSFSGEQAACMIRTQSRISTAIMLRFFQQCVEQTEEVGLLCAQPRA
jgi:hypothetical protein